jgi:hypothetical protein
MPRKKKSDTKWLVMVILLVVGLYAVGVFDLISTNQFRCDQIQSCTLGDECQCAVQYPTQPSGQFGYASVKAGELDGSLNSGIILGHVQGTGDTVELILHPYFTVKGSGHATVKLEAYNGNSWVSLYDMTKTVTEEDEASITLDERYIQNGVVQLRATLEAEGQTCTEHSCIESSADLGEVFTNFQATEPEQECSVASDCDAWCASHECIRPTCVGQWTCVDNTCHWVCDEVPPQDMNTIYLLGSIVMILSVAVGYKISKKGGKRK